MMTDEKEHRLKMIELRIETLTIKTDAILDWIDLFIAENKR